MRVVVKVFDAARVEGACATDDAVHDVVLAEEEVGEVASVLSRDARDEGDLPGERSLWIDDGQRARSSGQDDVTVRARLVLARETHVCAASQRLCKLHDGLCCFHPLLLPVSSRLLSCCV